nr:hypothetical protein [Tanacetum cinerariifolium]
MDRSFTLGSIEEADNVNILQSCNGLLLYGDDFGSREFTIYEIKIRCSAWMVRYRVYTDDFMTPLLEGWSIQSNVWSIVLGEREQESFLVMKLSGKVLDGLMEITGSTELHKRMRFWFVQEIAEEEGLLKFLRDRCDDLRRKNVRRRVLIREMEALGERGVAVNSLESLKQTHAKDTAKLAA